MLTFTRCLNGSFPEYYAADGAARYTIEQFGDGPKTWHLSYVDDNEVNERGNCPVHQVGRFATMTAAVFEARAHLHSLKEVN